jgi:hypothetical protein
MRQFEKRRVFLFQFHRRREVRTLVHVGENVGFGQGSGGLEMKYRPLKPPKTPDVRLM